jgi:hypothetical protein
MKKHIALGLAAWLVIAFTFFVPEKAFSHVDQKTKDSATTSPRAGSTYISGMTTGRARALAGVAVGLISLVIGWRARARSAAGIGNVRTAAILALVLGFIGIILCVLHLSVSAGAVFGSGSGKAGAIVGSVPSLIGMTLGWLALTKKTEPK